MKHEPATDEIIDFILKPGKCEAEAPRKRVSRINFQVKVPADRASLIYAISDYSGETKTATMRALLLWGLDLALSRLPDDAREQIDAMSLMYLDPEDEEDEDEDEDAKAAAPVRRAA